VIASHRRLPVSMGKGNKGRYVQPRLRRSDEAREYWHETRIKSRWQSSLADGVAGAERVRPAHAFVVEVGPVSSRHSAGDLARMGAVGGAQATREFATTIFTLSQLDTRRAVMAHGYVDVGMVMYKIADKGGAQVAGGCREVGYAKPAAGKKCALLSAHAPPPLAFATRTATHIEHAPWRSPHCCGSPVAVHACVLTCMCACVCVLSVTLEAHLDEGTYVLLPITGGIRPIPPVRAAPTAPQGTAPQGRLAALLRCAPTRTLTRWPLSLVCDRPECVSRCPRRTTQEPDDPQAVRDPYKPRSENVMTSRMLQGSMQLLFFLYARLDLTPLGATPRPSRRVHTHLLHLSYTSRISRTPL
jgi:hypothetical protein